MVTEPSGRPRFGGTPGVLRADPELSRVEDPLSGGARGFPSPSRTGQRVVTQARQFTKIGASRFCHRVAAPLLNSSRRRAESITDASISTFRIDTVSMLMPNGMPSLRQ